MKNFTNNFWFRLMFAALLCMTLFSKQGQAQCPVSIQITSPATVQAATCPSNGSFTIHDNGTVNVAYQIVDGPAGYPPGPQDSNTFTDLLPGDYKVKVYCEFNPSVSTTEMLTIPDQYDDVIASSATSNICTSSTPGGTITTTASLGSPPYQYAYFQGSPGVADNDPVIVYGSFNTFQAPAFGDYNVRVKDACGVFVTHQITVARTYPSNLCVSEAHEVFDGLTCQELETQQFLTLTLGNGVKLSSLPAGGIDIEVYFNKGSCASPSGLGLFGTTHFDPSSGNTILVRAPKYTNLIIKVKTPCGEECSFCYEYVPLYQSMTLDASAQAAGCPSTPGGPIPYLIGVGVNSSSTLPITYEVKNSSGTVVGTYTSSSTNRNSVYHDFPNLPADTYTVTATDACGQTSVKTVSAASGDPGVVTATATANAYCSSINGRISANVTFSGNVANLANSVITIVSPSPTSVGVAGERLVATTFRWTNLIPGATYTFEVDNQCGETFQTTVTVPNNEPQNRFIDANVQQLCGGTGNVMITAGMTGYFPSLTFDLLDASDNIVGSGTMPGKTFPNLPAGTYHAVAHVTGCATYDFAKNDIVILPGGSLPVVTKKLGVICEDGSGTAGNTGKAIVSFYGAQPLKVDYRLTSQTDADYVNITNDSDGSETIDNLQPNESYIIRVTDACGNSNPIQVSIGQLGAIMTEDSDAPCLDEAYTLSVPDMIDATYAWTKDGLAISNMRSIEFPKYSAGDNGLYQCTIVIGGCVTRIVNATLIGKDCSMPVTLASFSAKKEGAVVNLKWSTTFEANADRFNIERSSDAKNWKYVGEKQAAGESKMLTTYDFVDASPLNGTNYYRLKMIDKDASIAFSHIARTDMVNLGKGMSVYPNPVLHMIYLKDAEPASISEASIVSLSGKTVYRSNSVSAEGINIKGLSSGVYFLNLKSFNGDTAVLKFVVIK